jgi:predicted Zn-dependent peptidase
MIVRSEPGCNLIKIVALFETGRDVESKKALAQSVASMLKKTTRSKSNLTLQKAIDYYGATIEIYATPLYMTAEMYCLKQCVLPVLDLFFEVLFEAEFKSANWKVVRSIQQESIRQNEFQTDFWADKLLSESLFGKDGILGYYSSVEDYNRIQIEDIQAYYRSFVQPLKPIWFLAGDIDANIKTYIHQKEKSYQLKSKRRTKSEAPFLPPVVEIKELKESSQASIRLATIIPRQNFDEFLEIEILNTYLGGYYLSQLMKLLRIEKGYTYGAYTHCVHYKNYSMLTISFEADKKYIQPALKAIKTLFDRLKRMKTMDLSEAKEQYYSMWSKQSEKSLQELMYEIKLYKLGYDYEVYKDKLSNYKKQNNINLEKYKSTLLNFESYTQAIVF